MFSRGWPVSCKLLTCHISFSELLQPDQPEGAGGRALAHPVPVRRAPPHRQSFHAVNPTHAALRAQWHWKRGIFCARWLLRTFRGIFPVAARAHSPTCTSAIFSVSNYYETINILKKSFISFLMKTLQLSSLGNLFFSWTTKDAKIKLFDIMKSNVFKENNSTFYIKESILIILFTKIQ